MTHATWLPGAVRKPIPQTSTDPDIIPIGPIFHVAVSEASSLFDFFSHDGGIESTGYIRRDGTVEQYRPATVECDAQFDGNSWIGADGQRYGFTSWESQGMGAGEWTPEQVDSIKRIITWHHDEWNTPYRLCPAWNAPGVGYHCLFPQWNHNGHTCPGPDRVQQFRDVIVPWMTQPQEDDVTPEDIQAIAKAVAAEAVKNRDAEGNLQGTSTIAQMLTNIEASQGRQHKAVMDKLDQLIQVTKGKM